MCSVPSTQPPQANHQTEPIPSASFHTSSFVPIKPSTTKSFSTASIPISSEIRRQALNGNGMLLAYYDSQCYRCNVCKFKSVTSSILLQHLFTHMFFCRECPFFSYSRHNLHQHIFEQHPNTATGNRDTKNIDLLYLTRCPDGTFALSMDSSPSSSSSSSSNVTTSPNIPQTAVRKTREKVKKTQNASNPQQPRQKPTKRKNLKYDTPPDTDVIILSEKRESNSIESLPPPKSKPAPSASKATTHKYVIMKHRRCFLIKNPPCLHSLTLEYCICQEQTIRRMCTTENMLRRRSSKPKPNICSLTGGVAQCLKQMVNQIVDTMENRDSPALICTLPSSIIRLVFSIDDLDLIRKSLKLINRYDKMIESNKQNETENAIRSEDKHSFILYSPTTSKREQSIIASLHSNIIHVDSTFLETKLDKLPIAYDNTHRFLKGTIKPTPVATSCVMQSAKTISITQLPLASKLYELVNTPNATKLSKSVNRSPAMSTVDRNHNASTSSQSNSSSVPNFIVLD